MSLQASVVALYNPMKVNWISVLLSAIAYSALATFFTALFSLIPIEIIYYFLDLQNPFDQGVDLFLPLDGLMAFFLLMAIFFALPIVFGMGILILGTLLLRTKRPIGKFIGAIVGALVSLSALNWFFGVTEYWDLQNWLFWGSMICWGIFMFAWLGNRFERKYRIKDR